jgi:hypothetical protein
MSTKMFLHQYRKKGNGKKSVQRDIIYNSLSLWGIDETENMGQENPR